MSFNTFIYHNLHRTLGDIVRMMLRSSVVLKRRKKKPKQVKIQVEQDYKLKGRWGVKFDVVSIMSVVYGLYLLTVLTVDIGQL